MIKILDRFRIIWGKDYFGNYRVNLGSQYSQIARCDCCQDEVILSFETKNHGLVSNEILLKAIEDQERRATQQAA
jgi:hypothetical protein